MKETVAVHPAEVRRRLERFVERAGSQRIAAQAFGVSPQYLSAVLAEQKEIGPSLLKKLGVRRAVTRAITYTAERVA